MTCHAGAGEPPAHRRCRVGRRVGRLTVTERENSAVAAIRFDSDRLAELVRHVTDRDRYLAELVHEHRVLTTGQLTEVAFDNVYTANHRLTTLVRLRVLARARPRAPRGSAPYHYVLDAAGAYLLAAARDVDVAQLGWRRDRALALTSSPRLAHLVGANGVFTGLLGYARRHPGARLEEWLSEPRAAAATDNLVRPDGYGRWRQDGRSVAFYLEYDTGSEPLTRLQAKLADYAELAVATGQQVLVAFHLHSARREQEVQQRLHLPTGVRVVTHHRNCAGSPGDMIWLPRGDSARRRLVDCGRTPVTLRDIDRKAGGELFDAAWQADTDVAPIVLKA